MPVDSVSAVQKNLGPGTDLLTTANNTIRHELRDHHPHSHRHPHAQNSRMRMWQSALPRRSAAQTGAATPLSCARCAIEQMKIFVRLKAVLKPPHSRRWRDQRTPQPTRSVWSAACLPPLSSAQYAIEQIKTFVRSKRRVPIAIGIPAALQNLAELAAGISTSGYSFI